MRNPYGIITRTPKEWGSKARKDEDDYRGHRKRGRIESIFDQIDSHAEQANWL